MATFSKLKPTTKLSETQFYSVEKITGNKVQLRNDLGDVITVDDKYVEACLVSAEEIITEKIMSRTDLTNLFLVSTNVALTVNYNKQVDPKEVKTQLHSLYPNKGGKILSEIDYQKKVNSLLSTALEGEERTMIGRHYGSKDEFGRVRFIDMELTTDPSKDYDTRQRLVDTRTINWLILRGVKYKVK